MILPDSKEYPYEFEYSRNLTFPCPVSAAAASPPSQSSRSARFRLTAPPAVHGPGRMTSRKLGIYIVARGAHRAPKSLSLWPLGLDALRQVVVLAE